MRATIVITFLFHLFWSLTSLAHFDSNSQIRQFVISKTDSSTEVYVRMPVAFIFSDVLNGQAKDEFGFLLEVAIEEGSRLLLPVSNINKHRRAFTDRLAKSFVWTLDGESMYGRVRGYRLHPSNPESPFTSVQAAEKSLSAVSGLEYVSVGAGHIDLQITLPSAIESSRLTISNGLPDLVLSDEVSVDNHFTDFRSGSRVSYTIPGQLSRPFALISSTFGIVKEYVYQGVLHILEGLDHVLLVVVIALSAAGLLPLVKAVTAFTLGHAVTLTFGFLGYVPEADWFIPVIEALIAATVFIAALAGLKRHSSPLIMFIAIGLLHGFGFSFVLGNILGKDSPDLVGALASFTVGIELGQLAIVFAVVGLMKAINHVSLSAKSRLSNGSLGLIALVTLVMTFERVILLFS